MTEIPNTDIRSIQYLRGIAALAVFGFHMNHNFNFGFYVGSAGVDIFFVISGFIMWVTTVDRAVSPAEFMYRRIARVVPLYWIVTLTMVAAVLARPNFFPDVDASAANVVGSLLFLPNINVSTLFPVVHQGWTLTYEMFFYIIFAASLCIRQDYRLPAIVSVLIFLSLLHPLVPDGYAAVFTDTLLLEFAAGVLIGAAWAKGKSVPVPVALAAVIAGVVWLAVENFSPLGLERVIKFGGPAALIVGGLVFVERRMELPHFRFLQLCGDASYSIYLWHVLVGVVIMGLALRVGVGGILMPIIITVGSIAITLLAYVFVEEPINRYFRVRRKRRLAASGAY